MSNRPSRSLVRNAADPKQVSHGDRVEARRARVFLTSLRAVLGTPDGRAVLWDLIGAAGVYRSVWDPSARIHFNAGQQDFGHMLLARCLDADEDLYQLMEREGRARQRAEDSGTDAVQQAAQATTEGHTP
jgi:hypothetical protein